MTRLQKPQDERVNADDQPHISVLFQETLTLLQPMAGGRYIDGTAGAGGHTRGILAASAPDGRVMAFDRDSAALAIASERIGSEQQRVIFVHASYREMQTYVQQHNFVPVNGILLDLGLSSMQLDSAERGFAFRNDAPLDMRFDTTRGQTAADLVNTLPADALADILFEYGEIRHSRRLARAFVANRPITTTKQLADLVAANTPGYSKRHPATTVFQALRIAVNDELGALRDALDNALNLLETGGRLAIISFHSLEDRMVKQQFRAWASDCICPPAQPICNCDKVAEVKLITRKAVKPQQAEIDKNPRSRSARLRVAEKI